MRLLMIIALFLATFAGITAAAPRSMAADTFGCECFCAGLQPVCAGYRQPDGSSNCNWVYPPLMHRDALGLNAGYDVAGLPDANACHAMDNGSCSGFASLADANSDASQAGFFYGCRWRH